MKINLILDGNFLLNKNMHWLHKNKTLYGDLHTSVINNVLRFTSKYSFNRVFFVSDSREKSWRYDVLPDYKGKRVKDMTIDWDFVHQTYLDIKLELSQKYHVIMDDRIEGDDWIYSLVKKTNSMGYSNMVIASDKDLTQLVKYDIDKEYINFQISDILNAEKLYLPDNYKVFKNLLKNKEFDIMDMTHNVGLVDIIDKYVEAFRLNVVEINTEEVLLKKIVAGDSSDNIKSVYITQTSTGKDRGIGEASADKIWKYFNEHFDSSLSKDRTEYVNDVLISIMNVYGVSFDDDLKEHVINNINRNIKLIELHHNNLPDFIKENITKQLIPIFS